MRDIFTVEQRRIAEGIYAQGRDNNLRSRSFMNPELLSIAPLLFQ
jgi:hypothetical protein